MSTESEEFTSAEIMAAKLRNLADRARAVANELVPLAELAERQQPGGEPDPDIDCHENDPIMDSRTAPADGECVTTELDRWIVDHWTTDDIQIPSLHAAARLDQSERSRRDVEAATKPLRARIAALEAEAAASARKLENLQAVKGYLDRSWERIFAAVPTDCPNDSHPEHVNHVLHVIEQGKQAARELRELRELAPKAVTAMQFGGLDGPEIMARFNALLNLQPKGGGRG